ncbi:MAG: sulfotransferase [Proteobacteria bacterium]|nr:sulfotransferase [Pseudomonadota bacterium]
MATESPVFVVGLARSGTSALRTTLSALPAFASAGPRLPETRVFTQPDRIHDVFERRGRRLYTYLLRDTAAAQRMLVTLHDLPDPAGWRRLLLRRVRGADRSAMLRGLAWRLSRRHHLVRIFFHAAREARGCQRILEKTPHHVLHLPEVFATFPRAKVILCMRHPVDGYASLRKRLERDRKAGRNPHRLRWMEVTPAEYAERYRVIAGIVSRRLRRPGRSRLLRYEDLTADPHAALRELCDFVGEAFDEDRLLRGRPVERAESGFFVKGSRITASESAWRRFVTEEEARGLEDELAPAMGLLGYARHT